MESQLFTLSKIFTERLFRIPDYQRGYAWTAPQLSAFWSDLLQLEDKANHYTGVLTLETVTDSQWKTWADDRWIIESRRYEPLFVVDGQQRLTTAIILIQSIIEKIPEGEMLNYTPKSDIQRKFIYDLRESGVSRSYIFGYEEDNPSYEFLKTNIFGEFSSSSKSEETVYTNNLENAKRFFSEKLADMSKSELEAIFTKTTQQLLFNIFSISHEVDVCVAFETMNNRGKPLSELELLKNRLIYLSLKIDESSHERQKLRKSINDCWKAIYHSLGRNKSKPLDDDLFLSCHYFLYFVTPPKNGEAVDLPWARFNYRYSNSNRIKSSYKALLEDTFVTKRVLRGTDGAEPQLSLTDIYRYVSELQRAVEKWYQIFNPSSLDESSKLRPWLEKLDRLPGLTQLPLRLALLLSKDSEDDKIELLKKIEQYAFLNSLAEYPYALSAGDLDFIVEAIQLYREEVSIKSVSKAVADATSRLAASPSIITEIRKRFRSNGFYSWSAIRYFLYEYNLSMQSRTKTERRKLDWTEFCERKEDYVTIEHIFPQQARATYWSERFSGLSAAQRKALIHSLGNLVPLSKSKNSSLSNRPFPEKVFGNRDEVVGFRFGCYAEIEVSNESDWTPQRILDRGMKLLGFLEKRWGINLGSKEEKIWMLGLDFVESTSE